MRTAEIQAKLNTQHTDIFIRWNDTPTIKKLLNLLYSYNYNFVNKPNFSTDQTSEQLKREMEKDFYKWYHGNSKPILHIFYNDINGKNELQLTTQTIIKTYPQYKKSKTYSYFG